MKYVALLSGGKDSCFNLLHCQKNGHQLVAAASLGPELGKEELDSYMYQTVGQDAIEIVANALDVPLYRKVIQGTAVEQRIEYGGRASTDGIIGDETEDLYELLENVKSKHPEITGVSVGAILSNYQRVRVEHVCRRLSLVALCYLWQRSQAELLHEMIQAGMHVILIKVAGIGLSKNHLGKTLSEMETTLFRLHSLYGSHICGEGGEYESLTLDCALFKNRIHLLETEVVIHSDSDFASVAYLRIKRATLVPKNDIPLELNIPPILDDDISTEPSLEESLIPTPLAEVLPSPASYITLSSLKHGPWVTVTQIQTSLDCDTISVVEEIMSCFELLQEKLSEWHLRLSHCVNINLYISSMDLFASVNAVYARYFGTSPPARACVAVDLPSPYRVRLDCLAYSGKDRYALHVQSLSYWAPANIGPYSQAIFADSRVFISGQIGMIPRDLSLPNPRSLSSEMALSAQHARRIIASMSESSGAWKGYTQLIVFWLSDRKHFETVSQMHSTHAMSNEKHASVLYAAVRDLPKGALVEKQMLLHTGVFSVEEDGDLVQEERLPTSNEGGANDDVHWHISTFPDSTLSCLTVGFCNVSASKSIETLRKYNHLKIFWKYPLSVRLFYVLNQETIAVETLEEILKENACSLAKLPLTTIPCRFLATARLNNCDFIICVLTGEKSV